MPGGESFYPPVQYSPLWFLLGAGILILILAWYLVLFFSTRATRRPPMIVDGMPALTETARDTYVARIDDVGRRYSTGQVSFSGAHHELSALVRTFAAESRGVRAQFMTLEDLRHTPHRTLAETVGTLYPGAFSGDERGSVEAAIARAQELVRTWN
ncbi:MAG: hypothetical protein JWM51_1507 [Microbacteriaceae bacterium]|jgi:hypothetical protein|nr:hypothetical protein [Microbacteriaceae bacterium]